MKRLLDLSSHLRALAQIFQWTLLVAPVAILSGSASALLLWALHTVTQWRFDHPWLLYLLPLGGFLIALMYQRFGRTAEAGNNLILEEIHAPGGGVPTRMAPLILVSTVITHLFGGSAGREGTAVQMGGSLAGTWGRWFNFNDKNRRVLLMAGVAAGFGSVFGTPLAGAIFAMEVLVVGRMQYDALIPVLVASVIGDMACSAWGIHHLAYHIAIIGPDHGLHLEPGLLAKVAVAGAAFGLASALFVEIEHALKTGFKKFVRWPWLRPVIGGVLLIGLVALLGTRDYLGLGVDPCRPGGITILSTFDPGGAQPFSWWWKLLFTALTLACGFKGGEVTPLFFIGAALGHTLAGPLGGPLDLFAGLGFIAVFSASANTPLACTIMGAELFGTPYLVYFAVGCFVAYYFSGHAGIYLSQRLGVAKKGGSLHLPDDVSLRQVREIDDAFSNVSPLGWRQGDDNAKAGENAVEKIFVMNKKNKIVSTETGKIRIYLTPRERAPADGFWKKLSGQPLYRAIIKEAKAEGIMNASAFTTHYGYTRGGRIAAPNAEMDNPDLTLCVELIDHKDKLEQFCHKHAALLHDKTIVYKHVEHWALHHDDDGLDEKDSSPNEPIDSTEKKPVR